MEIIDGLTIYNLNAFKFKKFKKIILFKINDNSITNI